MMLVNAKAARNIPGRTDVSDAAWLAQLGAHGLLRTSFVPPEPIRELRVLTRARSILKLLRHLTRSVGQESVFRLISVFGCGRDDMNRCLFR